MTGWELATAVQYGANVIVLVCDNRLYGTIRMYQEKTFPGRYPATTLRNPDFVRLAQSFGAHGERVVSTDQFPKALARARDAARPALLELVTDAEQITPPSTLSALRDAALSATA